MKKILILSLTILSLFLILFFHFQNKQELSLSYLNSLDSQQCLEILLENGLEIPEMYTDDAILAQHTKTIIEFWYKNGISEALPFDFTGYYELAENLKVIIAD